MGESAADGGVELKPLSAIEFYARNWLLLVVLESSTIPTETTQTKGVKFGDSTFDGSKKGRS
jgi:hypothetical protein